MRNLLRWCYEFLPISREIRHRVLPQLEAIRKSAELSVRIQQECFIQEIVSAHRARDSKAVVTHDFKVHSQSGEDGIISEILRRVGTTDRRFVEIGVGDGLENNTLFLLQQGWSGTWLEGSSACCSKIRSVFEKQINSSALQLIESIVTRENIGTLLSEIKVVDVLSIDVDLNTYHIWESLGSLNARAVVVEYNGIIPPSVDWVAPYEAHGWWDGSSHFGASLKALVRLAQRMNYSLVGCDLRGINAFFVRNDLLGNHFSPPFTAQEHFQPLRHWLIAPAAYPIGKMDKLCEPCSYHSPDGSTGVSASKVEGLKNLVGGTE